MRTAVADPRAAVAGPRRAGAGSFGGPIAGLYAITPEVDDRSGVNAGGDVQDDDAAAGTIRLLLAVRAAIEGGARVVQYRNKGATRAKRLEHAIGLSAVCAKFGATFIINDDVALALEIEADGVHLGRADGDIAKARKRIGPKRLLGASCYNDLALAQAAHAAGADHVAFGSVFASSTKPGAVRAPLALFGAARALGLPLVAIGGITTANAAGVIAAGADAIAVISDLFDAPDVRARAAQFAHLFNPT